MKKIKLFTTRWCPFCINAKRLLKDRGFAFEEVAVDSDPAAREAASAAAGGWRTVPMIFIGDEFIGGYTELADLDKRGTLATTINP